MAVPTAIREIDSNGGGGAALLDYVVISGLEGSTCPRSKREPEDRQGPGCAEPLSQLHDGVLLKKRYVDRLERPWSLDVPCWVLPKVGG
jgi:hypothetical protein